LEAENLESFADRGYSSKAGDPRMLMMLAITGTLPKPPDIGAKSEGPASASSIFSTG